ncbi:hypothetical protein BGX33_012378 [Mortierella sp. NVP41]|nr:hypothetical protein BGX33_012378 [Mortierella sp. NVP41]
MLHDRKPKTGDNGIQRATQLRKELFGNSQWRKGKWTSEEDTLLEQLVHKFADIPQPSLWHKVSGGKVNDSVLVRSIKSCNRRWRQLFPPPLARTGPWTKEEERLLQESISEQLEGKYQVAVDVQASRLEATEHDLVETQPHLQQLPSQSGLPILKSGSRRLRMLSWVAIAERVKSRTESECHDHFYAVYHNGKKRKWSKEELRRAEEGFELFGNDNWKIAEHVGTRSPLQVSKLSHRLQWHGKERLEAVEAAQETAFDKKQE